MAATAFNGCISTIKSHGHKSNFALDQECRNSSLRLTSKGFKINLEVSGKERYCFRKRGFSVIQASSSSQTTVLDQVSTPLNNKVDTPKKSSTVFPLLMFLIDLIDL